MNECWRLLGKLRQRLFEKNYLPFGFCLSLPTPSPSSALAQPPPSPVPPPLPLSPLSGPRTKELLGLRRGDTCLRVARNGIQLSQVQLRLDLSTHPVVDYDVKLRDTRTTESSCDCTCAMLRQEKRSLPKGSAGTRQLLDLAALHLPV